MKIYKVNFRMMYKYKLFNFDEVGLIYCIFVIFFLYDCNIVMWIYKLFFFFENNEVI